MERLVQDQNLRAAASQEKLFESQTEVRRLQVHILKKKVLKKKVLSLVSVTVYMKSY